MDYFIKNDKRKVVNYTVFMLACLFYAFLEIFVFSRHTITDKALNTLWIIFQCVLGISPFLIFIVIKIIFNRFFLWICGIKNLSGKYIGKIISIQNDKEIEIKATIVIKHKFEKMSIEFYTEQSKSKAENICYEYLENKSIVIYNYYNEGNPIDSKNKAHIGTCRIEIKKNKLQGFYYNNGRDRTTYGSIDMRKEYS